MPCCLSFRAPSVVRVLLCGVPLCGGHLLFNPMSSIERSLPPYSTTPIAIISAGVQTPFYEEIRKKMFVSGEEMISGWRYDDLRKKLNKDPLEGGIGHQEDGRWETTQRCVIGQQDYDNIVIEHLKYSTNLIGAAHGILLLCNQGIHRTNTTGHTLEEAFNEPCWPNRQPVFNCKHFPLSEYYGREGCRKLLKDASNWLYHPVVDNSASGYTKPLSKRFGFKACSGGDEVNNLKNIQRFLEEEFSACISAVAEEVWKDSSKKKAPWRRANSTGGGNEKRRKHNYDQVFKNDNEEASADLDQDQDNPEWASLEFDARKWYQLLDVCGVDQHARQKLFMLASLNDEGKQEAWHLVYKLLWKGDKIWHPSKFIEKCTNNALKILVDKYPQLHHAEDLIDR